MGHQRIKELRHALSLTQKAFGEKIGYSQNHIASLETGVREITDRAANDICRVYGVNEEWLKQGVPPMFIDALKDLDVGEDVKQIANQYNKLNDRDKLLVKELINSLLSKK